MRRRPAPVRPASSVEREPGEREPYAACDWVIQVSYISA